ncbi:MAG: dodecin family protein [Desulfovibrionales bacterium]
MAVVKVIEIIAQSEKGWEEAVQAAVDEASKTVRNIQSVYVKEFEAKVENNTVTVYRVTTKISFLIERK